MIAVIIATYNRPEKLQRAIASAIEASEIVVADDGSAPTADVPQPAKHLILDHSGKPGYVKDQGIRDTTSPYVCCLDDDDWLEQGAIENIENYLSKNMGVDVLCTYMREWFNDKVSRPASNVMSWGDGPWSMSQLVVMRREVYFECGGYNPDMICGVNLDLNKRLWKYNPRLLPKTLYNRDLTGADRIGVQMPDEVRKVHRGLFQR